MKFFDIWLFNVALLSIALNAPYMANKLTNELFVKQWMNSNCQQHFFGLN